MRSLLCALLLAAGAAQADTPIRPQEAARLAAFDAHFGAAMKEAMAGGARGAVDLLQEALEGAPYPAYQTTLDGDWSCRTLKLGGMGALVAYAPFDCRFTADGDGFVFEKLSGSQRTRGRVSLIDGQMVYLGVGVVADAAPQEYAALPAEFAGDGEVQPQVALVEQSGPDSARLLFPAPVTESRFDILYLTR